MTTAEHTICETCGHKVRLKASGALGRHRGRGGVVCTPDQSTDTNIGLPWPKPPLSQNQLRRLNYHAEARLKARAMNEARWIIRAAHPAPVDRATVRLHYRPGTRRRCDADGLAPTLKVVLDALVHEGVLPDDDHTHVPEAAIRIHPPLPGMPGSLWVQISKEEQ